VNTGRLFGAAWRVVPRLPGALARGAFDAAAVAAWLARPGGVRRLEANLARVRPTASPRELRRLSRAGMRSYLRYYCEAFQLAGWSPQRVDARVRALGDEHLRTDLAAGRSVVLALAHCGNWDLAGAWAGRALGRVVTVVERLEPAELFREYVAFRESFGTTVIPLDKGGNVFRTLIGHARGGAVVIPLLADRDLTAAGVEVDLFGHAARVAPGPAALALATGARLYPVRITYERLRGARRRAAGGPWGILVDFAPPCVPPEGAPRGEAIAAMSQQWVDAVAEAIGRHPQDWHMLQRVFVEDLDPARVPDPAAGART
jgi:KDO2-lipid IV(A) lauroyltransferase